MGSAGTLDSSSVTVSQMLSPACQATDTALAGANTATALSRTEEPVSKERAEAPQRKRSISPPQELDSKTSGTTPLSWPAPARHQATTDVSMLTRSVHRELDSLAHSVQGDGRSNQQRNLGDSLAEREGRHHVNQSPQASIQFQLVQDQCGPQIGLLSWRASTWKPLDGDV